MPRWVCQHLAWHWGDSDLMSIKGTFNATLRDPLTISMSAQGTQDPMKIVRSGKESWYWPVRNPVAIFTEVVIESWGGLGRKTAKVINMIFSVLWETWVVSGNAGDKSHPPGRAGEHPQGPLLKKELLTTDSPQLANHCSMLPWLLPQWLWATSFVVTLSVLLSSARTTQYNSTPTLNLPTVSLTSSYACTVMKVYKLL